MGIDALLDNAGSDFSSNFRDPAPAPSGLGSSLTALAANPITGLVTGSLGLISSGVMGWLKYRQDQRDRKEAKKWYEDEVKRSAYEFDVRMKQQEEQTGLSRKTLMANLRQQQVENDRYVEETNQTRKDDWYQQFIAQINKPETSNKLLQIYGRK